LRDVDWRSSYPTWTFSLSRARNALAADLISLGFFLDHRRVLSLCFLLCMMSVLGQTGFLGMFTPAIRREFGLSHGEYGGLYSLATLVSGLTMPFWGHLLDRMRWSTVAQGLLASLALAALILAAAPLIWALPLGIYAMRAAGQGLLPHAAMIAVNRSFSTDRGKAVAAVSLGGPIGDAIFPAAAVLLLALLDWRWVLFCFALLALLAAFALAFLLARVDGQLRQLTEPPQHHDDKSITGVSPRQAYRDWRFWAISLALGAPPAIAAGTFFHQLHLAELKGWAVPEFARAYALMGIATIAALFAFGALADRFSSLRLLLPTLPWQALGLLLLGFVDGEWVVFPYLLLFGVTNGANWALSGLVIGEVFGLRNLGAIRGAYLGVAVIGTAIGPWLLGELLDQGHGARGVAIACLLVLLAAGIAAAALALSASRNAVTRQRP